MKEKLAFLLYKNGKYKTTGFDVFIDSDKYNGREYKYFIVKLSRNNGVYELDQDWYPVGVNGSHLDSSIECEQIAKHYAGKYFAIIKKEALKKTTDEL